MSGTIVYLDICALGSEAEAVAPIFAVEATPDVDDRRDQMRVEVVRRSFRISSSTS